MKRVFLTVLDSVGIGAAYDAEKFGDVGTNTLLSASKSNKFRIPNLLRLGLGEINGIDFLPENPNHTAAAARLCERSAGKDTTIGHWEICGLISEAPMPTFPDGFPDEIIGEFEKQTGRRVLCNKPYSGTKVINDYGEEHLKSGALIVYTSADSVFQIAAHEDAVTISELYRYCEIARKILCGKHAVGRVIARPFTGEAGCFSRTQNRRDFSVEPSGETLLDAAKAKGLEVIAIGKITDIFAGKGITKSIYTHGNSEGVSTCLDIMDTDFEGICFVNLVDFDMLYGHRNDVDGYAAALSEFDSKLPEIISKLRDEDALIITADHGCDPASPGTDHTREFVPMLMYGKKIKPVNLGTRDSFADIAATVSDMLDLNLKCGGKSFFSEVLND